MWREGLFAVVATGDSMYPEICDRDVVVCDKFDKLEDGDLVYYRLFNEVAINYNKDNNNTITFKPINNSPEFFPRTIDIDDEAVYSQLEMARVVQVIRPIKRRRK